ncbi:hypothetical protein BpHYR1_050273 [Brachionus plicatilis]|uniref:Uncharacterized protein n=1 Tax=Brachionus plicatilis TaxID=10195 RepID=A0A3M7RV97_BRAPC|nr:hypothetical protein BpHYR1_050273 [Brachionus plicatilis]
MCFFWFKSQNSEQIYVFFLKLRTTVFISFAKERKLESLSSSTSGDFNFKFVNETKIIVQGSNSFSSIFTYSNKNLCLIESKFINT